jgi:hypothetical protein
MVAVAAVPLLAMMALAVDVGLILTARDEAQRAADSGALGGAGVFLSINPDDQPALATSEAHAKAVEFATRNAIRNVLIDESEVTSEVLIDQQRVRVTVRREAVPTYFARILGFRTVEVSAISAAEVTLGTSTLGGPGECVLPFAMPDLWDEATGDDNPENDVPDPDEEWEWDVDDGDVYYPYDPDPDNTYGAGDGYSAGFDGTGYGSDFRADLTNDYGRRIWVKLGPPGQSGQGGGGDAGGQDDMIGPGQFQLWEMPSCPESDDMGGPNGANPWIEWNIENCNPCNISINPETGTYPVETEQGNKEGAMDALAEQLDEDPNAFWDETCNCIRGSKYGTTGDEQADHDAAVANSERVRIVALFSPEQIPSLQGSSDLSINNFAKIFLEGGGEPGDFAVYARFLGPVSGNGGGEESETGSLIRYLRLVE